MSMVGAIEPLKDLIIKYGMQNNIDLYYDVNEALNALATLENISVQESEEELQRLVQMFEQ
jgi:hypothetical protein